MDKKPRKTSTPRARTIPILEDLRAGLATGEIAKRHGVSPNSVSRLRYHYRIGPPTAQAPHVDAVLEDLRAGLRYRQIAERHDLTVGQVEGIARKHDLQRTRASDDTAILADLQAGMTYNEVAARHGKTFWQVRGVAVRAGLRRQRGGKRPRTFPKPPPPERK